MQSHFTNAIILLTELKKKSQLLLNWGFVSDQFVITMCHTFIMYKESTTIVNSSNINHKLYNNRDIIHSSCTLWLTLLQFSKLN